MDDSSDGICDTEPRRRAAFAGESYTVPPNLLSVVRLRMRCRSPSPREEGRGGDENKDEEKETASVMGVD